MKNKWDFAAKKIGEADWLEFVFFSANFQHVMQMKDLDEQLYSFDEADSYCQQQRATDLMTAPRALLSNELDRLMDCAPLIVTFHYGQFLINAG